MSASIAGVASLVATLSALASISASSAGVGSLTATMQAVAGISATIAGVATVSAAMSATGEMGATSGGTASFTATMTGLWSIAYGSMTFTRSSQGSYYTQAPTNGSTAFIAVASTDVLRTDSRDGNALTLLEGARTNSLPDGRAFDNNGFTSSGSPTITANAGPSPDGATNAERAQLSTNQNRYRGGMGTGTLSAFARAVSGTTAWQISAGGSPAVGTTSLSTTYLRQAIYGNTGGFALYADAFDRTAGGGITAAAEDIYIDFMQFEASSRFASSPIGTNGSTITRSADTLTLASASVPALLFTAKGRFTQLSPIFANTDLVSGDQFWLLSIGGSNNGIRIYHNGTDVRVEALAGGLVVAQSQALTFARDALLGVIAWDPVVGVVSVNGTNGPSGTPWSWTSGNIRVGGIHGGAGEAFCRFGALESW